MLETLALNPTQFLTLERSYTIGEENVIRLFITSVEETTTNLISIKSLVKTEFVAFKKELLLNFKSTKQLIPSKTINNIEVYVLVLIF